MAHYIDIDKIEYRKGVLLDSEENPLPIIHKVATIEVIRDWTPRADVVERSNIDKAIEEMQNHREFSHADFKQYACEDYHFAGLRMAIEILKRNIGE